MSSLEEKSLQGKDSRPKDLWGSKGLKGLKALGSKAKGLKSKGSREIGLRSRAKGLGTKGLGTKGLGTKALGTKALGTKALSSKALGTKALSSKALGTKASGPQPLVYSIDSSGCKNVLLIDSEVPNAELFATSTNALTFPIIYSTTSTKAELLALLKTSFPDNTIDRIGLVFTSDGSSKRFLDKKPFFSHNEPVISPYSENVEFILSVLKEFSVKNIDYLACDTLNSSSWVKYYALLTKETSVIVGASNDKTGNIKYGGDWIMESTGQDIELIYFTKSIEYYTYLLDIQNEVTIITTEDGTLYGTGINEDGELGLGDYGTGRGEDVLTPIPLAMNKTPQYISCGRHHTIVLMTDGTLYGTGRSDTGQLGLGIPSFIKAELTPIPLPPNKTPKYIASGGDYTIVLMTDGSLYGTGYNEDGELGLGYATYGAIFTLTAIPLPDLMPKYISCGRYHTIVLMTDGTIYGTGYNNEGQLGVGDTYSYSNLVQMNTFFTDRTPKYVSCGKYHTAVLMTDGTIWGTGYNDNGELGLNDGSYTNTDVLTEMDLSVLPEGTTPQYISCGRYNTLVLMTDGTIWGTGDNSDGELGLDNTNSEDYLRPMIIPADKTPRYISGGYNHTVVIMTDGTLYGTGSNSEGELGLGSIINEVDVLTPIPVPDDKKVSYVSDMLDERNMWALRLNIPEALIIHDSHMYVTDYNLDTGYGIITKLDLSGNIEDAEWFTFNNDIFPHGLDISGAYMYVACYDDDNDDSFISIINIDTGIEEGVISLSGDYVAGLIIHGDYIYVSEVNYSRIIKINIATGIIVADEWVTGLDRPIQMVIAGAYMYVTNRRGITITKIKLADGTKSAFGTGFYNSTGLAIAGDYMYVTNIEGTMITQLNLADGSVANPNWASGLQSTIFGGVWGEMLVDGSYLYVANTLGENFDSGAGTVNRYSLPTTPTPVPNANICFPAGTPIQTDQGIIAIEKLQPARHTINKKPIVDITKSITSDKFLVGFKKNALGANYPSEDTMMTQDHKILYQGKMSEAKTFLGKNKTVGKVKYEGEILYNVLMEDYSQMRVNNLICETLHHDNIIAKLYAKNSKHTGEERDKIVILLKECLKKKDYKSYNKIAQRC